MWFSNICDIRKPVDLECSTQNILLLIEINKIAKIINNNLYS